MKRFSLATLLLGMVIASLVVSQAVLVHKMNLAREDVARAEAEIAEVRSKFGYIRVEDPRKTYVARVKDNTEPGTAYRVVVPAGSRYLLHLTDTTAENGMAPDSPKPTRTISLNGWTDGADVVLSYSSYYEDDVLRFRVHTEAEDFFNYVPKNWQDDSGLTDSWNLPTEPQVAYNTNETIRFMVRRYQSTNRVIMLWLEPYADWEAREAQKKPSL